MVKDTIRRLFLTHIGDYVRTIHLLRQLSTLPPGSLHNVLDAGCGDGHHSLLLAKRFPSFHVTGIDIDLRLAGNGFKTSNVTLVRDDLLNLEHQQRYDFIFSIDVLEHIPDNQEVLRRLFAALRPGGYFYLHLPNKVQLRNILPSIFLKDFREWEEKEHVGILYDMHEIRSVLTQVGFDVINAQFTFGLLGKLAWEMDRATDKILLVKALLMPFMKTAARISTLLNARQGDLLLLSKKPAIQ